MDWVLLALWSFVLVSTQLCCIPQVFLVVGFDGERLRILEGIALASRDLVMPLLRSLLYEVWTVVFNVCGM